MKGTVFPTVIMPNGKTGVVGKSGKVYDLGMSDIVNAHVCKNIQATKMQLPKHTYKVCKGYLLVSLPMCCLL